MKNPKDGALVDPLLIFSDKGLEQELFKIIRCFIVQRPQTLIWWRLIHLWLSNRILQVKPV
ncbi:MAG TPA: hypothetical protein DDW73_17610 [Rhizobium sp.]|nr:hypothetical protein [Rhizobium sp.]